MNQDHSEKMHSELTPAASEMEHREISWRLSRSGMEKVGVKLRRLRKEKWMPLEEAAKAASMPKGRLNKIERGTYVQFDLIQLKRLCKVYGVTAKAFLATYIDIWFDDYAKPK